MLNENDKQVEYVMKFVKRNIIPVQEGRKCVDGRYLPAQASGMIARPGGDGGYVMALMAVSKKKNLGLTAVECFDLVYKLISKDGPFYMHTDHHGGLIGCGHLAKAAMDDLCKDYDVEGKEVRQFVEYVKDLAKVDSSVEIINLAGDHQEKAVLIVKSGPYAINSYDPDLGQMYFVYDEERDNEFMKKLVDELSIEEVTFEDLKRESDVQLQATLYNLAKGLSIYSVEFVDSNPDVTYIGEVV